ncbi:MAG: helicase-associated domain-containing protein [Candidatus Nanopelagicaceae bacterium]
MSLRQISTTVPSFADELRARTDEELHSLFTYRPDLITPVPGDIAALATRATSGPSLVRAIEGLNQWQFAVLEACMALAEPFTSTQIVKATEKGAEKVVTELYERGLIYKDEDGFRVPRAIHDFIGQSPAGLGPVSIAKLDLKKLKDAPKPALDLLAKLTWGSAKGTVSDIRKRGTPIAWLIENHFLIPMDQTTVVVPRELGLHLRGGKVHQSYLTTAPTISGDRRKQKDVDQAAIASISNVLRWCRELLNFWAEETPSVLQSGGLGVRDLRKCAEHLGVEEICAAFIAEICYLGGLVVADPDGRILPTTAFDMWQVKSPEEQWRELVTLWLLSSRVAGLIGKPESKNINPLGFDLDRANAATIRKHTVHLLLENKELSPEVSSAQKFVEWVYPNRRGGSLHSDIVEWTLRECDWLGITGQGALSSFGERFINDDDALKINEALPKPVDHILIQSDNTAIAPGPLAIDLDRHLSTFADIESRGGATVYRFSEASIRRGLDHGHSGDEIRTFLSKTSKTPMPQPLEYLISDVAKKHGRLKVGFANTYLRCEDEVIINQILKDKRLEHLRLRAIAPQVLVSELENSDVIEDLRSNGYFPTGENSSGAVLTSVGQMRAKSRPKPPRIIGELVTPSETIMATAIRTLRAGERASAKKPHLRTDIPRTTANETLEILNKYLGEEVTLVIGYADTNGGVTQRVIDPVSISLGTLLARDHASGQLQHFKIPRITGVVPA